MTNETFRYDVAAYSEPRIILITDLIGRRSDVPRLGYVVLPQHMKPMSRFGGMVMSGPKED
jgi:hypothetical protein